MKVKDLIAKLSKMPLESQVYIAHHAGDLIGTTLAIESKNINIVPVGISRHHYDNYRLLDEDHDPEDFRSNVIVIS